MSKSIRLLLSYSHDSDEHKAAVLALAQRLRCIGIDAWLDRFEPFPKQGWQVWMEEQIKRADFVLLLCTQIYQARFEQKAVGGEGKGVSDEGGMISQLLYDQYGANEKFIPVLLERSAQQYIPTRLKRYTNYVVSEESEFDALYRLMTGQPEVIPDPIGQRVDKSPISTCAIEPLEAVAIHPPWSAFAERLRFHQFVRAKINEQLTAPVLKSLKIRLEDSLFAEEQIKRPTTFNRLLLDLEAAINTLAWLDHYYATINLFHYAVADCLADLEKAGDEQNTRIRFWEGTGTVFGWLILLSVEDGYALQQKLQLGDGVRFEFTLPVEADNVVCVEIVTSRMQETAANFTMTASDNVIGTSAVPNCPESGGLPQDAVVEIKKAIYQHLYKKDPPKNGIRDKKLNAKLGLRQSKQENYYVTIPVSEENNPLTNESVRCLLFQQLPSLSAVFIGVPGDDKVFVTEEDQLVVRIEDFLELYREQS